MQCQLIFYCDLDGVLTDFERHMMREVPHSLPQDSFWANLPAFNSIDELRTHLGDDWYKMTASLPQTFWEFMPWIENAKSLWKYLENYPRIILSTPASSRSSRIGKQRWIQRELGSEIPNIIQPHKERYVKQNLCVPNSIQTQRLIKVLIDDLDRNIDSWIAQGGVGILHKSVKTTIKKIREIEANISV